MGFSVGRGKADITMNTMNVSVVAQAADVKHNEEEVYLSCFNSEVERSIPATKLPMHNGMDERRRVLTSCE